MGYRNRVVTVFGGSGFLGRHLIRRLAKTGAVIRVASRHPSQAGWLKTAGSVGQIAPIAVNTGDDRSVATALEGADLAVNLIGILYERGRSTFQAAHVDAAARIARQAAAAGVQRLAHVSALGATTESLSAYARTKAAGEQAVRQAFPAANIFRPSVLFGPEDDFFNRFAAIAQYAPALPLIGGGTTRLQPAYVGDVAEAIALTLEPDAATGQTWSLGGPEIYTLKQIMALVASRIGRHRLLVPVPWAVAEPLAGLLQYLPTPPLTPDQVELLKADNVVPAGVPGFADLGIAPTAAEVILPTYLDRYRTGSRFARSHTTA